MPHLFIVQPKGCTRPPQKLLTILKGKRLFPHDSLWHPHRYGEIRQQMRRYLWKSLLQMIGPFKRTKKVLQAILVEYRNQRRRWIWIQCSEIIKVTVKNKEENSKCIIIINMLNNGLYYKDVRQWTILKLFIHLMIALLCTGN